MFEGTGVDAARKKREAYRQLREVSCGNEKTRGDRSSFRRVTLTVRGDPKPATHILPDYTTSPAE